MCYAADSGSRYSPEDALVPGGYAGEGNKYWWSATVNFVLQPSLGLRWLLCYEESDAEVCHLQKAAPKNWFKEGEKIIVERCPTRFGTIGWQTNSLPGRQWLLKLTIPADFKATLKIHMHPDDGKPIRTASMGIVEQEYVSLSSTLLSGKRSLRIEVT